jgi:hypothetical protein
VNHDGCRLTEKAVRCDLIHEAGTGDGNSRRMNIANNDLAELRDGD